MNEIRAPRRRLRHDLGYTRVATARSVVPTAGPKQP
ncbi:hypothetical protein SAMN05421783_10196 [Thiocapsa roseopersicina]|uniref:Uncharacterized protein n=1 Tax=Thiocapsa roseopersicina TaxID=1058 RepID=A0A1H2Q3S2_THIRO|nr:hypothetical protein SAMN05421783_10196 [Thiocapsa roseopersicina]